MTGFQPTSAGFGIAVVQAEQVCANRGFIISGAGSFNDDIAIITPVFGQQHCLIVFQPGHLWLKLTDLGLRQLARLLITPVAQAACFINC
jgi:hypothetical protein